MNRLRSNGETPLHLAVRKNNLDIVECLIKNNAKINQKNFYGETPLDLTKTLENPKIAELFKEKIRKDSFTQSIFNFFNHKPEIHITKTPSKKLTKK